MRKTHLFGLLLLLTPSLGAAEITARPGLWEVTTTSALLGLVPEIPQDQLQKLSKLAMQYGVVMPRIQNGAATSKICVTPQMAEQKVPDYFHQRQSGCSVKKTAQTENGYKLDLICAGPEIKGSGKAEGVFTDPETFSGQTEFNGTVRGTPINDHADTSGRWIGENCKGVSNNL
ncbi:MAG TPA: DUF3617 domain-containing protein [Nitrosospira sp.]